MLLGRPQGPWGGSSHPRFTTGLQFCNAARGACTRPATLPSGLMGSARPLQGSPRSGCTQQDPAGTYPGGGASPDTAWGSRAEQNPHLGSSPQGRPEGRGALRQEPSPQGAAQGAEGERAHAGEQVRCGRGWGGLGKGAFGKVWGELNRAGVSTAGLPEPCVKCICKAPSQTQQNMEHLAHRVGVGWGFHSLGMAGAHLGSRAVRVPAPLGASVSLLRAASHPRPHRLRAGLCDRCMVTQELARKKQQDFENSLLQSLQHVFILSEPRPLSPCTSVSPPVGVQ